MQHYSTDKEHQTIGKPMVILVLATAVLVVNFWAWSLLSPLATQYARQFNLDQVTVAILLAMPVLIGSLGRIPAGLLTDTYGGRLIFGLACLLLAIPVVGLIFVQSLPSLLLVGVLLGVGGASFAIGVPLVSGWFPADRRGLALGIYGMGNAGSAVSGFLTPQLSSYLGRGLFLGLLAAGLVVCGLLFLWLGHNAPTWQPATDSMWQRFKASLVTRITWELSVVYIITFGAFVAFAMYLPVLLEVAYDLQPGDAAARAAGFVMLATLARPLGGWLSDRVGGIRVIKAVLAGVVVLSAVIAFQPILTLLTTGAFLSLAVTLGSGSGAVVAVLSRRIAPEQLGGAMGVVGAVGGLGGFLPPLFLGLSYQMNGSYVLALVCLSLSALVVLGYVATKMKA